MKNEGLKFQKLKLLCTAATQNIADENHIKNIKG
jgi:hypothetical protein